MKIFSLPSPQCQRGMSLIEVLIAVLVLSIGLLGLGALQGLALQSGQLSTQRSQATALAYRITDEYRAYRSLPAPPLQLRNNWDAEVGRLLPNGSLTHARNGDVVTVTVSWRDARELGGPAEDDAITIVTRI